MKFTQKTYKLEDQKDRENLCAIISLQTSKKVTIYSESKGDIITSTQKAPEWAKELIKKVDIMGNDIKDIKSDIIQIKIQVDSNTKMIKQAHPELFK